MKTGVIWAGRRVQMGHCVVVNGCPAVVDLEVATVVGPHLFGGHCGGCRESFWESLFGKERTECFMN